jgi:hypothetical protein
MHPCPALAAPPHAGIINIDLPKIATQALGLSLGAWHTDLKVRKEGLGAVSNCVTAAADGLCTGSGVGAELRNVAGISR